jgi:membrane-anchored mycosin MYCP
MPTTVPAQKDQIVVALAHQRLVEQRLHDFLVEPQPRDADADLGLALLDLDSGQVAAAGEQNPGESRGFDGLLERLYISFRNDYHWVPTFGKNRKVERVVAGNQIGGGGEGGPTAAEKINWPARAGSLGAGLRVAVADTAVAPRPQLVGSIIAGAQSLLDEGNGQHPLPAAAGHATFVTGLVLKEAPGATVQVGRVLEDDGTQDSWEVAKRIVQLSRRGVDVLNLSLGCFTDDDRPPLLLMTAIDRLDPATVVVAAAGNHGETFPRRPLWPAALDDVVAVGATGCDGRLVPWSPDPAHNPWVDVLACGENVESTYLTGPVCTKDLANGSAGNCPVDFHGFACWSGTSFASARVSGKIAAAARPPAVSAAAAIAKLIERAPERQSRPFLG